MKKRYEIPVIKATSLQSEESVANVCWAGNTAHKNLTWAYYGADHVLKGENDPEGWLSFQVHASNCKQATASNVIITYQGTANDDLLPDAIGIDADQQKKLYSEFISEVNVASQGSEWAGEGTVTPIISSK